MCACRLEAERASCVSPVSDEASRFSCRVISATLPLGAGFPAGDRPPCPPWGRASSSAAAFSQVAMSWVAPASSCRSLR